MTEEAYKETIKRIVPLAEKYIHDKKLKYPINDSMKCLTNLGYYIIKSKAPQNLSGFYMKKDNLPFIFVNTNHSLGRQNFSMWHEVYHHISGHENGISEFGTKLLEEREAEIFAGCILLPKSEIKKWSDEDFNSEITLAKISDQRTPEERRKNETIESGGSRPKVGKVEGVCEIVDIKNIYTDCIIKYRKD